MTVKYCDEELIRRNVEEVREQIANAAIKAGRNPGEITLVGVSKTQPPQAVRALINAGVEIIGENRVQELLEKEEHLKDIPHKTHLIGHLQRNKAKFLPGHVDMVQSLSSVQTMQALQKAYADKTKPIDVLIEVNIGDESSKTGIDKGEVMELAAMVCQSKELCLRGLMAIPPYLEGEAVRIYFAQMYQLFIDIKAKKMDNNTINVLSMGMSSDFEFAIAEGSTMVRVGTRLFGQRNVR